jgi:hypothetical protein
VLAAAGSANAEPKQSAPAKKGCEVQLKGEGAGQSVVYADGYSFSVYAKNDSKTHDSRVGAVSSSANYLVARLVRSLYARTCGRRY